MSDKNLCPNFLLLFPPQLLLQTRARVAAAAADAHSEEERGRCPRHTLLLLLLALVTRIASPFLSPLFSRYNCCCSIVHRLMPSSSSLFTLWRRPLFYRRRRRPTRAVDPRSNQVISRRRLMQRRGERVKWTEAGSIASQARTQTAICMLMQQRTPFHWTDCMGKQVRAADKGKTSSSSSHFLLHEARLHPLRSPHTHTCPAAQ